MSISEIVLKVVLSPEVITPLAIWSLLWIVFAVIDRCEFRRGNWK